MKNYYWGFISCMFFVTACELVPTDIRSTPPTANTQLASTATIDTLQQNINQCREMGLQASANYYFPIASCESIYGIGRCQPVVVAADNTYWVCYRQISTTSTGTGTGHGTSTGTGTETSTGTGTGSGSGSSGNTTNFTLSGPSVLTAVTVGSTGSPAGYYVFNSGSSPISCSGPTLTGTNANQFSVSGSCGVLTAGSTCSNIQVTARPTLTGTKTANLNLTCSGVSRSIAIRYSDPVVILPPDCRVSGTLNCPTGTPLPQI